MGVMENIELDAIDLALVQQIQGGLPLVSQPYAAVGAAIGIDERDVMVRINRLRAAGIIKRMGVVVRHRELGYRANAMVVWDVPDTQVAEVGGCLSRFEFVTLCYRRPRRLPEWPYNLFTMIHGADEEAVRAKLRDMIERCALGAIPHAVLFSRRRFKQRGARYLPAQRVGRPLESR